MSLSENAYQLIEAMRQGDLMQFLRQSKIPISDEICREILEEGHKNLEKGQIDEALELSGVCIKVAEQLNNPAFLSQGYALLCVCKRIKGDTQEALIILKHALESMPEGIPREQQVLLLGIQVHLLAEAGQPDEAVRQYQECEVFRIEQMAPDLSVQMTGAIAASYREADALRLASEWYGRAYDVAKRNALHEAALGLSRDHAHCLMDLGELEQALRRLKRAEHLAEAGHFENEKGWIKLDQGVILLLLRRFQEAENILNQARDSFMKSKNQLGIVRAKINLANVFLNTERSEQAMTELEKILQSEISQNNPGIRAIVLLGQCHALTQMKQWDKVESLLKENPEAPKQLPSREKIELDLLVSRLTLHKKNWQQASVMLSEVSQQFQKIGAIFSAGEAEVLQVEAELKQKNYEAALSACEQAGTLFKKTNAQDAVVRLENFKNSILMEWVNMLLNTAENGVETSEIAKILKQKGKPLTERLFQSGQQRIDIKTSSGQIEQACNLAEILYDIALAIENKFAAAQTLHRFGVALKNQTRADLAIDYEEKALSLYEELDDQPWVAGVTMDVALAYKGSGQMDKALELAIRALEMFENQHDVERIIIAHTNIGNILKETKRIEEGIEHLKQALHLAEERRDLRSTARIIGNLGGAYLIAEKFPEALNAYQQAYKIGVACGDKDLAHKMQVTLQTLTSHIPDSQTPEDKVSSLAKSKSLEEIRQFLKEPDCPPPRQLIELLMEKGSQLYKKGKQKLAFDYFTAAERVCQCLGQPQTQGNAYLILGANYIQGEFFDRAFKAFEEAANFFGQIQREEEQANCFTNAARAALLLGDKTSAVRCVNLAINCHKRLKILDGLAYDLVIQGELELSNNNISTAMKLFREAIDLQVERGSFVGITGVVSTPALKALEKHGAKKEMETISTYASKAGFHLLMDRWPTLRQGNAKHAFLNSNAALLLNEEFLVMFVGDLAPQAVDDGRLKHANILLDIGYQAASLLGSETLYIKILLTDANVQARTRDTNQALSLLAEVESRITTIDRQDYRLKVFLDAAKIAERIGNYKRCIYFYDRASRVAAELKNPKEEAHVLMCEGIACKNFGLLKQAVGLYRKAFTLLDDPEGLQAANIYVNLGNALEIMGNRQEAIETYEKALSIAHTHGDPAVQASAYIGLGIAAKNIGDFDEAEYRYQQALILCDRYGLKESRDNVLKNKAILDFARGENQQDSDTLAQKPQSMREQAVTFIDRAIIESEKMNFPLAIKYQKKALGLFKKMNNQHGIAMAMTNLASFYGEMPDLDKALKWIQQAIKEADRSGGKDIAIEARQIAARLLMEKGEIEAESAVGEDSATPPLDPGKEWAQQIKKWLARPREKLQKMAEARQEYCNKALEYLKEAIHLIDAAKASFTGENNRMAFIERNKQIYDRAVMASIGLNDDKQILKFMEKSRGQTFLDLFEKAIDKKVFTSVGKTSKPGGKPGYKAGTELAEADSITYDYLKEIWTNQVFGGKKPDKPTLILMYYFINDYIYYIYALDPLSPQEMEFRDVFTRPMTTENGEKVDWLTVLISQLRLSLNGSILYLDQVNQLEKQLRDLEQSRSDQGKILEIRQQLKQRKAELPQALASLEELGAKTRQELYHALVAPLSNRIQHYQRLIIVPHKKLHHIPFHALMDEDGLTLIEKGLDISYIPSLSALKYCYYSPGVSTYQILLCMGDPNGDLPMAAVECEEIAKLYPNLAGEQVFLGKQATRSVLQKYAPEADIIHLAMHGQYDSQWPLNSSLVFNDEPLTVRHVYNLDLTRAQTAVLSTCLSGMSTVSESDELLGLIRGFFHAGVSSVIASLWPVHSDATAKLMKEFHSLLRKKNPGDKANALREAMLKVKNEHPYTALWAPFCLYGRHN
ncbi:MAG: CHAT domain-containing protein [Candidatus Aminicenantes bacterium]|nr:MAG: CHAT domain-containing protein [Candidatus Aminicenantes bacterium]